MQWWILGFAILSEVSATLCLKIAVDRGRPSWYLVVILGYVIAFSCLAWSLSLGLPIGIAYGVWAACGVALTAIFARLFLREPLTRTMACGILVIVVGVWLVDAGH